MAPPYHKLSNFYETPVDYQGLRYPSSEHAYQATKYNEKKRFAIGGDLSTMVALKSFRQIFFSKNSTE